MKAKARSTERDQLVKGALVQLLGLQMRSGTPQNELQSFARECVDDAARIVGIESSGVEEMFDAQDYGSVLRTWHREAKYLSAEGFPRPLAMNGKFGLRRLIERYYPRDHYQRVLQCLQKAGLVRRHRDGKWRPSKKFAVFPRLNDALLVHVAEGVSKLVQTVTQNVTSQRKDVLFERSALVRAFPIDAGPAFREFVNSQASAFLSTVDDWLEARSAGSKARGKKTCTAGVFSFAFIDDLRPDKSIAPSTKRKKAAKPQSRGARQLIPQRPS